MRLSENEKGTSIVEFAIILPVLLILIFGMVEFAALFYNKAVITNASREGARAAIVFRTDANGNYTPYQQVDIQTIVNNYVGNYLIGFPRGTATIPAFTPCPQTPTPGSDNYAVVQVSYGYHFLVLQNLLSFLQSPFTLSSSTTMACENRS